jgi:hypothetical protein
LVDDIDSEFTHVEFDILIASDALDADFASRDTGTRSRLSARGS